MILEYDDGSIEIDYHGYAAGIERNPNTPWYMQHVEEMQKIEDAKGIEELKQAINNIKNKSLST